MKLDFDKYDITLVIAPVDGRYGFDRLAAMARIYCDIEVEDGRSMVVFISRRCSICKIIFRDAKGRTMIARWLNHGTFQRCLARANESDGITISRQELLNYLDGEKIQKCRSRTLL